jgi:chromosome segregation ATPase
MSACLSINSAISATANHQFCPNCESSFQSGFEEGQKKGESSLQRLREELDRVSTLYEKLQKNLNLANRDKNFLEKSLQTSRLRERRERDNIKNLTTQIDFLTSRLEKKRDRIHSLIYTIRSLQNKISSLNLLSVQQQEAIQGLCEEVIANRQLKDLLAQTLEKEKEKTASLKEELQKAIANKL